MRYKEIIDNLENERDKLKKEKSMYKNLYHNTVNDVSKKHYDKEFQRVHKELKAINRRLTLLINQM